MSRAFMKEADESTRIEMLPDRLQSIHPNYVTSTGLRELELRVAELAARRKLLSGQDTLGDRQELSVVERDLRFYEERVKRAILVDAENKPIDRVHFGASVRVRDDSGTESCFSIVGEDEADASQGKISWVSPLATALMNQSLGDYATWHRPAGDKELEIVEIGKP